MPQTIIQSLGDRVVGVNFVPFIRSRTITFTAQGMRPNTRVHPFFDEQAISVYVTPDVVHLVVISHRRKRFCDRYFCNT